MYARDKDVTKTIMSSVVVNFFFPYLTVRKIHFRFCQLEFSFSSYYIIIIIKLDDVC